MKELIDYYENWKIRLLALFILCYMILSLIFSFLNEVSSTFVINYANNPNITWLSSNNINKIKFILDFLFDYFSPIALSVVLYVYCLDHIDKEGWKKKFPQYNVSGKWSNETTYRKSLVPNKEWDILEEKKESIMTITQTCRTIKVEPSPSEHFKWHSLLANWDEHKHLHILYEVRYFHDLIDNGRPEIRIGYEQMTLVGDDSPYELRGNFSHCLSFDGKPMFMGNVVYKSLSQKTK